MKYFLLLLVAFPLKLTAQCDYFYYYIGEAGAVVVDSFAVIPNDLYQIDVATLNVPDGITIYNNREQTDSLYFYIGSNATHNPANRSYNGYCEFEYNGDTLIANILRGDTLPVDYHVDSVINSVRGCMRLYYWVPDSLCNLVFKVWGNKENQTIYAVCIRKLATGYIVVSDTIHQPYCGRKYPIYLEGDCSKSIVVFDDYAIYDTPIVHHGGCIDDVGWIEFPQYPQFNKYDLGVGVYDIVVANQYCEKKYTVEIPERLICQYYVPNVFKVDGGNNGRFIFFTKTQYPYRLKIFDRWGDLVCDGQFISNVTGWDGITQNGEPVSLGVYVYQIECLDLTINGDVTVVK